MEMSNYYTVNEMYGEKFYQVPKVFFTNPLYKDGLSPLEKMAFGLLKDRFSLSKKNGWFDEEGRIYFIFTQEELMEIFGCSKQTASNIKKNLAKVDLLEVKKRGQGKADVLYLKKPIVTNTDIYEIDKAESVGAVETSKNQTSRSFENRRQEVSKIDANDTDFKDIDLKGFREREIKNNNIYTSAIADTELVDFIEKSLPAFQEKNINVQKVISWLEENEDIYTYRELTVGLTQLLEYPEQIDKPINFLNSTFGKIEYYVEMFNKKHLKKIDRQKAKTKQPQEELQTVPPAKVPFYNWLEERD